MKSKTDLRANLVKWMINTLKKLGLFHKKKNTKKPPSFLIVSATGVGDTLWSTPALQALKQEHPDSTLHVLTSPLGYQVLLENPHIDELFLYKKFSWSLLKLFRDLSRQNYHAIIFFHVSHRWMIPFCYFLKPTHLIGFERHAKSFSTLLTEAHEVGLRHPILQRLSLIESFLNPAQKRDDQIRIFLKEKETLKALDFLKHLNVKKERLLIGLQPGASQPFKQWPLKHFIALAKMLSTKYPCEFVIFGSQDERPLAESIQKEVPVHIASGKLALRVSAALIGQLDLMITNDTGPMHLALAQQVRTVCIFSPTTPDLCWPHQMAPWVQVLYLPKTCATCIGHKCYLPYCMERIEPSLVFNRCCHLLDLLRLQEENVKTPSPAFPRSNTLQVEDIPK